MLADAKREIQELRSIAMEQGWRVETRSSGHIAFFPPNARSPVFSGGTPSDPRAVKNLRAQLRRAGLELDDRPTKKNGFTATIGERIGLKLVTPPDQRCPHDGVKCNRDCENDGACKRLARGLTALKAQPGYPKEGYIEAFNHLRRQLMPPDLAATQPQPPPPAAPAAPGATLLKPEPGEALGDFVKRARLLRGLSQDQCIAHVLTTNPKADATQPWLSGLERGRYLLDNNDKASALAEVLRISFPEVLRMSQAQRRAVRSNGSKKAAKTRKKRREKNQDPIVIATARTAAERLGLSWEDTELPREPLFENRNRKAMTADEEHWLLVFLANGYSTAAVARVLGRTDTQSLLRLFRQIAARAEKEAAPPAPTPEPKPAPATPPPAPAPAPAPPTPPAAGGVFVCPKCNGTGQINGTQCVVPVCGGKGVVLL